MCSLFVWVILHGFGFDYVFFVCVGSLHVYLGLINCVICLLCGLFLYVYLGSIIVCVSCYFLISADPTLCGAGILKIIV